MPPIGFPQIDIPRGVTGGSDVWDNDSAGVILSEDFFGSAGGLIKVWDGASWQLKPVKVWDGASWQTKPVKYWDGSAWVIT